MAQGDSCSRQCESAEPVNPRIHIRGYDFSRIAFNDPMATPPGLGRPGRGLDFDSGGGFFHARPGAGPGGKIRAAVAASHCGTAAATAAARGIDGFESDPRSRAAEICATAANRARGNFDDMSREGRRVAVPLFDFDLGRRPGVPPK